MILQQLIIVQYLNNNGDCRLWSDNDEDASDIGQFGTNTLGGLISGTSKCIHLSGGSNNPINACYPTKCFRDSSGSYVGTRLSVFNSSSRTSVKVLTCWSDQDGVSNTFPYDFPSDQEYGFDKIKCPVFNDICYDANPWYVFVLYPFF